MINIKDKFINVIHLAEEKNWNLVLEAIKATPELTMYQNMFRSNLLIELLPNAPLYVIQELVVYGTDLRLINKEGFSCLHKIIEECDEHDIPKLEFLIEAGADINSRGWNSWTPLHQATSYDCILFVEALLKNGADVSIITEIDDYETPLMIAKRKGNKKTQLLLSKK